MTNHISDSELEEIVEAAVSEFYLRDSDLFKYKIHEVALSHRFAIYLEKILRNNGLSDDLSVDLEYNKNIYAEKFLSKDKGNGERPDIVVHERGNHGNNLLIIEIKKSGTSIDDSDDQKLKGATNPLKDFQYKLGLFLILEQDKILYGWYSEGEKKKEYWVESSEKS